MTFFPLILKLLRKGGLRDHALRGGVIPLSDVKELKKLGVRELFRSGTNTADIVAFVKEEIGKKKPDDFVKSPSAALRCPVHHAVHGAASCGAMRTYARLTVSPV